MSQFNDVNIVRAATRPVVTIFEVSPNGEQVGGVVVTLNCREKAEALAGELQRKKAKLGLGWQTPNMQETLNAYRNNIVAEATF